MLGLDENRLRVVAPEVGGGFGSKLNVYAEEALMGFIAMKIGKPVKWIESRRENFLCTIHGRGHVDYYEIAAKRDGTILGLKLKLIQDLGAYHQLLTPAIPTLSVLMMPGLYNFRNIDADIVGVVHQLRSHRRLSRRGTPRSHPRHRAHGGYSGRRTQDGPRRDPPQEFRQQRPVPVPHRHRPQLRFRRLRGAAQKALDMSDYHELRERAGRGARSRAG